MISFRFGSACFTYASSACRSSAGFSHWFCPHQDWHCPCYGPAGRCCSVPGRLQMGPRFMVQQGVIGASLQPPGATGHCRVGHGRAHVAVRGEQRRMQEVDAAGGAHAVPGPLRGVASEELRDHLQQVLLLCMSIIISSVINNKGDQYLLRSRHFAGVRIGAFRRRCSEVIGDTLLATALRMTVIGQYACCIAASHLAASCWPGSWQCGRRRPHRSTHSSHACAPAPRV